MSQELGCVSSCLGPSLVFVVHLPLGFCVSWLPMVVIAGLWEISIESVVQGLCFWGFKEYLTKGFCRGKSRVLEFLGRSIDTIKHTASLPAFWRYRLWCYFVPWEVLSVDK